MKTRADYIQENLEMLTLKINNNENFSIIKIGDGEIDCMQNKKGENIDKHPYSKELSDKLNYAFTELFKKKVYIAEWFYSNPPINKRDEENQKFFFDFIIKTKCMPNYIRPFEILMLGWGNLELQCLFNFYQTIKNSNRNKIYVGPSRISGLQTLLSLNHFIEIPLINAFSEYDNILENIKSKLTDDSIVMMSIGLQSPAIANELLNYNKNITILDIGSGFDPLYVGQTRGPIQANVEQAKNYYKNL